MKLPALGQIPLEHLDLVVDSKNPKIIPNPEHGDNQMSEEYWRPCPIPSPMLPPALKASQP